MCSSDLRSPDLSRDVTWEVLCGSNSGSWVAEHVVDVAYLPALKPAETQNDLEVFCSTSSFSVDALGLAALCLCPISIRRIPDWVFVYTVALLPDQQMLPRNVYLGEASEARAITTRGHNRPF